MSDTSDDPLEDTMQPSIKSETKCEERREAEERSTIMRGKEKNALYQKSTTYECEGKDPVDALFDSPSSQNILNKILENYLPGQNMDTIMDKIRKERGNKRSRSGFKYVETKAFSENEPLFISEKATWRARHATNFAARKKRNVKQLNHSILIGKFKHKLTAVLATILAEQENEELKNETCQGYMKKYKEKDENADLKKVRNDYIKECIISRERAFQLGQELKKIEEGEVDLSREDAEQEKEEDTKAGEGEEESSTEREKEEEDEEEYTDM